MKAELMCSWTSDQSFQIMVQSYTAETSFTSVH